MRGVYDEKKSKTEAISSLRSPKSPSRSSIFEVWSFKRDPLKSPTDLLAMDMTEKCAVATEPMKDKAKESWKKRLLYKKREKGQFETLDFDETVEISFERESSDTKEFSFESTSSKSPGLKSSQVSFNADSSIDGGEVFDVLSPKLQDESIGMTKKEKETKKQRLKRIISRPLRRSQSACYENDIPSHALFLESKGNRVRDTMESRAMDMLLYQRLFGESEDGKQRKIHKTFSVDVSLSESEEYLNNNVQPRSKALNIAKNVKRRFQFLRRQNTDSVVDSEKTLSIFSSTTYDQALQWGKSLDDLLKDKNGLEIFLGFLRSEFSEENLEFWIACEDFKNCNDTCMAVLAQKICNEFVVSKAPREINLDADTRMATITNLENLNRDSFNVSQHKIQALMAKDSYPRFLESDIYQFILENVSKM